MEHKENREILVQEDLLALKEIEVMMDSQEPEAHQETKGQLELLDQLVLQDMMEKMGLRDLLVSLETRAVQDNRDRGVLKELVV